MKITHFNDPVKFQAKTRDFLMLSEAENNLPLGILASIIAGEYSDRKPYLMLVEEGDKPCLVALCTPPYPVIFSYREIPPGPNTLSEIINDIRDTLGEDFTGITGNKTLISALAETWQGLTGNQAKLKYALRIYKLERVSPVTSVPGRMRPMAREDEDLVLEWYANFHRDGLGDDPDPSRVKKQVLRYMNAEKLNRGLMIWDLDGKPVSMAGYSGPTPNGIRIGAVYTPDELRRKGYASACTAGLSQHLLDLGFKFCFLFTDLLNPTSNHIYQQIGFEPVSDVDQYSFKVDETKDEV